MKSKTLATWIALIGGSLGLHRFYLHGWRDVWGWLHPLPTLLGLYGLDRVSRFGQDDHLSWALIPLAGVSVAAAMLMALVYGLTADEKWDLRFNPQGPATQSGWAAIIGVVLALLVGAGVLMATIAFSGQRFFEYQIEEARKISR
ncbi:hypothetical protein [Piscinibacter sp.]|uniref:hypothetical protein n=1 Tax=Piscinibacter sp. TaxID=1903157 RepID=UPI002D0144F8|nr:hypothetical protein [Albitalea sp.]HUG24845.1 hypothetical protein [Albitalea sp.]